MESSIFNILEFVYPRLLEIPVEATFQKKENKRKEIEI
jgi:hypothetical protein